MGIWKTLLDILAENRARKCTNLNITIIAVGAQLRRVQDRINELDGEIAKANEAPETEEKISSLNWLHAKKNSLAADAANLDYLRIQLERRLEKVERPYFFESLA